jgi:YVTN family beta-propeller protein
MGRRVIPRRTLCTLVTAVFATAIGIAGPPAAEAAQAVPVAVGDRPLAIAVNSVTGGVYVANTNAATVSVLDGRRKSLLATVPAGQRPSAVAVNESTNRIYVASPVSGSVTVIDGATNKAIDTLAGGQSASVLGVDEAVNRIYVGSATSGKVTVLDGVSSTVLGTVDGPGSGFSGVSVDSGRRLAYFSSLYTDTVEVLDTNAGKFVASIKVGHAPAGLAVQRTTNTLYVSNSGIHHLSVVDGTARAERKTILLRSEASSTAVREGTNTVYSNGGPDGIVKIDGAKGEISGELPLGVNPGDVAVDQRTGTVFVTDPLHDLVSVITDF